MAATENSRLITSKDALYAVKNCLFCIDHKWNKEKITLNLCVDQTQQMDEYFIVGNISELGRWTINNKMKK